jgi:hypothetical protein
MKAPWYDPAQLRLNDSVIDFGEHQRLIEQFEPSKPKAKANPPCFLPTHNAGELQLSRAFDACGVGCRPWCVPSSLVS